LNGGDEWKARAITATDLHASIVADVAGANQRLAGRTLSITGRVRNVEWEEDGVAVIALSGAVTCVVPRSARASIQRAKDMDYTKDVFLVGNLVPVIALPSDLKPTMVFVMLSGCVVLP
jgi:hypothetical protein